MTAPARPDPIPGSYRRVTPCLTVHGAGKALEFYAAVFGAAERMRFPGPDGTIAHAEIQIGDSVVIVEDEDPQRGTKAPPPGGLPGSLPSPSASKLTSASFQTLALSLTRFGFTT